MTRAGDMGTGPVKPEISVVVSPELLAHIAGAERRFDAETALPDHPAETGSEGPSGAVPSHPGEWQRVSLRRDGRRPYVCTATVVARGHDSVPVTLLAPGQAAKAFDVSRDITLYRQETGEMLVHAIYTPPEAAPARPTYRLMELRDATAWRQFFDHVDAASCFHVQAQSTPHVASTLPRPFYQMSDAMAAGQQL